MALLGRVMNYGLYVAMLYLSLRRYAMLFVLHVDVKRGNLARYARVVSHLVGARRLAPREASLLLTQGPLTLGGVTKLQNLLGRLSGALSFLARGLRHGIIMA